MASDFSYAVASTVVDGAGRFVATFTVPANLDPAPGTLTILAQAKDGKSDRSHVVL